MKYLLALAIAIGISAAPTPSEAATVQACAAKGSFDSRCVWDAKHMHGDGRPDYSFVTRYVDGVWTVHRITHHRAHELLGF